MNIALSSDNNYARHLHIVVNSILVTNKNAKIRFYILDTGINSHNKELIADTVRSYSQEIFFLDSTLLTGTLHVDNSISVAAYSRLFLTRIKEIDKIIYLDCDSLVNEDLTELWNIDLGTDLFAGVLDFVAPYYKTLVGLSENDPYINSGMLVMNLAQMRKVDWEDKVLEMISRFKGTIPHCDQGIANALGKGHVRIVSPKYNVIPDYLMRDIPQIMNSDVFSEFYSDKDILEARQKPVFIHFTTGFYGRPWDVKCTSPLKQLYLDAIVNCGYKLEDVLEDKPENPHMVLFRKIYYGYPHWVYSIFSNLVLLRNKVIWMYKLRNIQKQSK